MYLALRIDLSEEFFGQLHRMEDVYVVLDNRHGGLGIFWLAAKRYCIHHLDSADGIVIDIQVILGHLGCHGCWLEVFEERKSCRYFAYAMGRN